jgi:hypothetical protein
MPDARTALEEAINAMVRVMEKGRALKQELEVVKQRRLQAELEASLHVPPPGSSSPGELSSPPPRR